MNVGALDMLRGLGLPATFHCVRVVVYSTKPYDRVFLGAANQDQLARLLTFPNLLVTSHQAFFTREAMTAIADTTFTNLGDLAAGRVSANTLRP